MEELFINAKDGYQLLINVYESKNAKAVIQIAHGMEEHQKRYQKFAEFLSENGFTVVTANMRGHGPNAKELGFFAEKQGDLLLVDDQVCIAKYLKEKYSDKSLYLFAHSMGTIISRVVLQKHSKLYEKVILSGYPNYQSAAGFGKLVAKLFGCFKGKKGHSKMLNNLVVGSFNKAISNPKTNVDWISYNEENVKKYLEDPLCGFGFTISGYRDLMSLVVKMHKVENYIDVNKDLKFLLLRGEDDPCVGGTSGAEDSLNVLLKAGFLDIEKICYPHMRHEILNEDNHQQVYQDCLDFLNK